MHFLTKDIHGFKGSVHEENFALAFKQFNKSLSIPLTSSIMKDYYPYHAMDKIPTQKEILTAINLGLYRLANLPEQWHDDEEIVLAAVSKKGVDLKYASPRLQQKRKIVLVAVKNNGLALMYAPWLRDDRQVVMQAVTSNPQSLLYATDNLKADKALVMQAIRSNGLSLQYAFPTLKMDREVVLTAVNQEGRALEHAGSDFKQDKEIVLAAVSQNLSALEFASEEIKQICKDCHPVLALKKAIASDKKEALEKLLGKRPADKAIRFKL